MKRTGIAERKTLETDIKINLNIDGSGKYNIKTPIPFLNHMLELFSKHGLFDLTIKADGDVAVDYHHTVEDIGICLGQAIKEALGKKESIKRYGDAIVPMDEASSQVSLDISGRPFLVFNSPALKGKVGNFDLELVEDFFQALANSCGISLHINVLYGRNHHHIVEAIFKAFARALDSATQTDERAAGIPSTKGVL
jgi:imidazoleglycerol-phosphate dehydratase